MTDVTKVETKFPVNVQTETNQDSCGSPSSPMAASRLAGLAKMDNSILPDTFSASRITELNEANQLDPYTNSVMQWLVILRNQLP
jgi:hypothetical protein